MSSSAYLCPACGVWHPASFLPECPKCGAKLRLMHWSNAKKHCWSRAPLEHDDDLCELCGVQRWAVAQGKKHGYDVNCPGFPTGKTASFIRAFGGNPAKVARAMEPSARPKPTLGPICTCPAITLLASGHRAGCPYSKGKA